MITATQVKALVAMGQLSENEGSRMIDSIESDKPKSEKTKWVKLYDYVHVCPEGFVKTKKTSLSFEQVLQPCIANGSILMVKVYTKMVQKEVRQNIQVIVKDCGSLTAENFKAGSTAMIAVLKSLKGLPGMIQLDPAGKFTKVVIGEAKDRSSVPTEVETTESGDFNPFSD